MLAFSWLHGRRREMSNFPLPSLTVAPIITPHLPRLFPWSLIFFLCLQRPSPRPFSWFQASGTDLTDGVSWSLRPGGLWSVEVIHTVRAGPRGPTIQVETMHSTSSETWDAVGCATPWSTGGHHHRHAVKASAGSCPRVRGAPGKSVSAQGCRPRASVFLQFTVYGAAA